MALPRSNKGFVAVVTLLNTLVTVACMPKSNVAKTQAIAVNDANQSQLLWIFPIVGSGVDRSKTDDIPFCAYYNDKVDQNTANLGQRTIDLKWLPNAVTLNKSPITFGEFKDQIRKVHEWKYLFGLSMFATTGLGISALLNAISDEKLNTLDRETYGMFHRRHWETLHSLKKSGYVHPNIPVSVVDGKTVVYLHDGTLVEWETFVAKNRALDEALKKGGLTDLPREKYVSYKHVLSSRGIDPQELATNIEIREKIQYAIDDWRSLRRTGVKMDAAGIAEMERLERNFFKEIHPSARMNFFIFGAGMATIAAMGGASFYAASDAFSSADAVGNELTKPPFQSHELADIDLSKAKIIRDAIASTVPKKFVALPNCPEPKTQLNSK